MRDDGYLRVEAHACPMTSCAAPAVRKPGTLWIELPRPAATGAEPAGDVRIGYARASTVRQSLGTQLDSVKAAAVTRIFSEKISTRATTRPELDKAVTLARELRSAGVAVALVVHEHKRLGRGLDLAALSGMEREYIRDRTLGGHESARARGKSIGGAAVTDDAMLSKVLHLRQQNLSLRDIAARLVITKGAKKGRHPSPATVLAHAARSRRGRRDIRGRRRMITEFSDSYPRLACTPDASLACQSFRTMVPVIGSPTSRTYCWMSAGG
ncbi:recombinase family protein [Nonomuraea sp. ZG12]|uniref:recombinase family protein n=1 Tax=Nonomuraea sp. ZG12 TaxID=3452207 RepID=UPI003F8B103B